LTTRAYGRPKVELDASGRKVTYEATGGDAVRTSLARADGAFARLSDETIRKLLGKKWQGPRAAPQVAAALALSVGAFGYLRRSTESQEAAIERVAKEFRLAETKLKRSNGPRARKTNDKSDHTTGG
jgi:hypothetical protein